MLRSLDPASGSLVLRVWEWIRIIMGLRGLGFRESGEWILIIIPVCVLYSLIVVVFLPPLPLEHQ